MKKTDTLSKNYCQHKPMSLGSRPRDLSPAGRAYLRSYGVRNIPTGLVYSDATSIWYARSIRGYNVRRLPPASKAYRDTAGSAGVFALPAPGATTVVVEDAVSALKVHEVTGLPAIALLGVTAPALAGIRDCLEGSRVKLWLDDDGPGYVGSLSVACDLRLLGVSVTELFGLEPKHLSAQAIRGALGLGASL